MHSCGTHGPKWDFLSENLQGSLINFLYSSGIHPDLGLCVEYLSWNREQRLYMGWLRNLYSVMFLSEGSLKQRQMI